MKDSLPVFSDANNRPIQRIANDSQLRRYLKENWQERSKVIEGVVGLSIDHDTKRWHLNLKVHNERKHRTLGTYPTVPLYEARRKATELRDAIRSGKEQAKRKRHQKPKLIQKDVGAAEQPTTINSLIRQYFRYRFDTLKQQKTNKTPEKAIQRMEYQYEHYIQPVIGNLAPEAISNSHIISILASIKDSETTRTKTKAVVSLLIQWLIMEGHINVDKLNINWQIVRSSLSPCSSIRRNYPRMSIEDIPRFVARAMKPQRTARDEITAIATLVVLLTAQRIGNILEMDTAVVGEAASWFTKWGNVDFETNVWTIPPECLKVSKTSSNKISPPLRIPLATQTINLLRKVQHYWQQRGIQLEASDFVIPKYDNRLQPHKSHTVRLFIQRLHDEDLAAGGPGFFDPDQPERVATTHGFRSDFQDWCITQGFPMLYTEKALAHETGSKVQQAYQRNDFLEERRAMMQAWADYCFSECPK